MDIYGAHIHTENRHRYLKVKWKGGAVNFKEAFVKSLLKFINKNGLP